MWLFKNLSLLKYFVFITIFVLISANFTLAREAIIDNLDADEIGVTGFYRVEKIGDVWWFITPAGNKFYSIGVSGIGQPIFCYDAESDYVNITTERLQEGNINTVLGDTDPFTDFSWICRFRWKQLSYLNNSGWNHDRFPDVFDPWWQNKVNTTAMNYAAPLKNDSSLIGYFTDNEMKWGPDIADELTLLDVYIAADWHTPGKKAVVQFLKGRYNNDTDLFNQVWNMNIEKFEDLLNTSKLGVTDSWRLRSGYISDTISIKNEYENLKKADFLNQAKQDTIYFSEFVADKYFNITNNAIKKADPNHLNLGVRFHLQGVPEEVLRACGKYLDVVSINYYRANVKFYDPVWVYNAKKYDCVPLDNFMEKYSTITDKPIFISEYSFHINDGSMPQSFQRVSPSKVAYDQEERYKIYEWYASNCFKSRYVIGLAWFVFSDTYGTKWGFVNQWNEPYSYFLEKMSKLNSKAISMHENSTEHVNDFYPGYINSNKIYKSFWFANSILYYISNNGKLKNIFNKDKITRTVCESQENINYDILVKNDGTGNYKSIQQAINNSSPGDVIFVENGIYKEKIIIDKPLKLIGKSAKNTTISGFHADHVFTGAPPENNFVVTILSDNVTIEGFNITSHGTFNDSSGNFRACAGVNVQNCDNCVFSDNVFYKLGGWAGGGGLLARQTANLTIKNNTFLKISGLGVVIDKNERSEIKNNNFIDNSLYGMWLSQLYDVMIYNNLIEGSKFGITVSKTKNTIIDENIFQDNKQKCLVLKNSTDNNVTNNKFTLSTLNLLNNKYSSVMFFYETGNHWEGNYWFEPRCLPRIIFGKIGYDSLKLSFEYDLKPAAT